MSIFTRIFKRSKSETQSIPEPLAFVCWQCDEVVLSEAREAHFEQHRQEHKRKKDRDRETLESAERLVHEFIREPTPTDIQTIKVYVAMEYLKLIKQPKNNPILIQVPPQSSSGWDPM